MYYQTFADPRYIPWMPTYNGGRLAKGKKEKTHSTVSTRKSSTDSIDQGAKFKTEMCKYYVMRTECPFNDMCNFAHGEEELRNKERLPNKYKTKPCTKFSEEGYCPYGQRCQFIHSHKKDIIDYEKVMDKIGMDSQVFFEYLNAQTNGKARRLSFFEQFEGQSEGRPRSEGYESSCCSRKEGDFIVKVRHYSI